MKKQKKIVIGAMAHVDAGKTSLTEALLYESGALRTLGRVDHGDAFLDTSPLERKRGITIFSQQAVLTSGDTEFILLDTPGHADLSSEMERALQVLDCAILVVSGTDGVQAHTRTLWKLLAEYDIPTFLFVNKMDLPGTDRAALLKELQEKLDSGVTDFTSAETRNEGAATGSEEALEQFLSTGEVSAQLTADLIARRCIFPCWFGSALRLQGISELLRGLDTYTAAPARGSEFGARVFKISRDSQNIRLTWMKITGGSLAAKTVLTGGQGEDTWQEKADQLRIYSGERFEAADRAEAGALVAVTGLTRTYPGEGLGSETGTQHPRLEPVLSYQMILPEGADPHTVLPKLRQLEEEDPTLRVVWEESRREIRVRLMGQIQLEVLRSLIAQRFGLEVDFGPGSVLYKETIAAPVEGIGHFEPLRHYAEVHLLMEPGPRGSGLQVGSALSTDVLDLNWQRLILTHLLERDHAGVLTGSPITDMKITIVAGRAHVKHTEGGDFRQATYRAVRQGLMSARSILLEPCYSYRLEVPPDCVGRAIHDIQTMGGSVEGPEDGGELVVLTGTAPVSGLQDYWQQVAAYARGLGRLSCTVRGYEPCPRQEEVVQEIGYDPLRDTENPADSVFCAHGGGFVVPWDKVRDHMHLEGLSLNSPDAPERDARSAGDRPSRSGIGGEQELQEIFERTYGKVPDRAFRPQKKPARTELGEKYDIRDQSAAGPEYLLVDGYNIIFAWEELNAVAKDDVAAARAMLEDILINYRAFRRCELILVFDAYRVKGGVGSVEKKGGIYIVYTKEAETADSYIERTTYDLSRDHRVRVATSDAMEQVIILGHGALRVSARSFKAEVEQAEGEISQLVARQNMRGIGTDQLKSTAKVISMHSSQTKNER